MVRVTTHRSWSLVVVRLASVTAFFALWEMFTRLRVVTAFLLPSPTAIVRVLIDETLNGELLLNAQLTLYRTMCGFVIAAVVGIVLGIAIARIAAVRWFFDPLVSIALPMPQIAFLPIFILWLGVFDASKIVLIACSALLPILVHSRAGAQGIDKFLAWSAISLGVTERALLWDVALPAALPQILTGVQVALPIAFIVAITAEMLMGGAGLGGSIIHGMRFSDSPELFAGIVAVAVIGYAITKAMELLRGRLLVWHSEAQRV